MPVNGNPSITRSVYSSGGGAHPIYGTIGSGNKQRHGCQRLL